MNHTTGAASTPIQPPNRNSAKNQENLYITTCKLCPGGIYKRQTYTWLRKPLGYSHDICIAQARQRAGMVSYDV